MDLENQSLSEFKLVDISAESNEIATYFKEFLAVQQLYSAAIKEIRTKFEILDEEFKVKYNYNPIHQIESRLKTPKSILEKLKRKL